MCQGFRLNKARCLFLKQALFFEAAVLDLIIGSGLKPNHHNQVKLVNIPDTHHTNRLSSSKMWKTQTTGCGNSVIASVLGCFLRFRPFSSKLSLNTLTMRIFFSYLWFEKQSSMVRKWSYIFKPPTSKKFHVA